MIPSNEQAKAALEFLRATRCDTRVDVCALPAVSSDVLEQAREVARSTPDSRLDRVEDARVAYDSNPPSAQDVAEKLIMRVASDSVR